MSPGGVNTDATATGNVFFGTGGTYKVTLNELNLQAGT